MKFLLALCFVAILSLASSAPSKSWEQGNKERELSQKDSVSIKERETDQIEAQDKSTTVSAAGSESEASAKAAADAPNTGNSEKLEAVEAKVESTRAMGGMMPIGMMHPMAAVANQVRAGHGRAGPTKGMMGMHMPTAVHMGMPMGMHMGMPMGMINNRAGHGRREEQGPMHAFNIFGAQRMGQPMDANVQATATTHGQRSYNNEHAQAALENAREQFELARKDGQPQARGLENQAPFQGQGFVAMPQFGFRGIGHPQMRAFG
ncbi:uncharacterized protein LOC141852778 [Brevipalpus obovatus]|uniref:uncharacterized protein LOC141852778 n=1 Tax=Brevipalpus obovatus TaxID=246614 RepID=UPI003D9E6A2B